MKQDTKEKWALVTGASEGIGKDFAWELSRNGYSLILVARRENLLKELSEEIKRSSKVNTLPLALDASLESSILEIVKVCNGLPLSRAILSAGFGSIGEFQNLDLNNELAMVDLNCKSVVSLSHRLIPVLKQNSPSGLILFGSLVGFQGSPYSATYAATKAFVQSFAEALYHELKPYNISVLSVAPGPVESGFGKRAKMKMGKAQPVVGIAKTSLNALGKQSTVRPGFLSKFLGYSLITLPRGIRVLLMKQIMKGMIS